MNEQNNKQPDQTDEIGNTLESGGQVNRALEKQGYEANVGILRAEDAAKHDPTRVDEKTEQDTSPDEE